MSSFGGHNKALSPCYTTPTPFGLSSAFNSLHPQTSMKSADGSSRSSQEQLKLPGKERSCPRAKEVYEVSRGLQYKFTFSVEDYLDESVFHLKTSHSPFSQNVATNLKEMCICISSFSGVHSKSLAPQVSVWAKPLNLTSTDLSGGVHKRSLGEEKFCG